MGQSCFSKFYKYTSCYKNRQKAKLQKWLHNNNIWREDCSKNVKPAEIDQCKEFIYLIQKQHIKHSHRIAFVVRACNPSVAMLSRIKTWFHDISSRQNSSLQIDLHLSVDITHNPCTFLIEPHIYLHTYTSADMEYVFPVLKNEMSDRVPPISQRAVMSHRWGFHVEAIGLWYKRFVNKKYDYVWVVEEDVGFTGSVYELINSYTQNIEDLLVAEYSSTLTQWNGLSDEKSQGWCWHDTVSMLYSQMINEDCRLTAPEHVQRFSAKCLLLLFGLSRRKICAWSEQSCPTLVSQYLNLGTFHGKHVGSVFSWDGNITQLEWEKYTQRSTNKPPQMWHALKF